MPNWWDLSFVFRCLDDGGRPFPVNGCPVPDVGNIHLIWIIYCMGYCFCICPPPCDVFVNGLYFLKTIWTGWHGHPLYQISLINQDTRQECFRLSNRSFLWCCRPWVNRLPPVRWSTFSFMFVNGSWCENLITYPRVWPSIITLQCCNLARTSLFRPAYVSSCPSVRHFCCPVAMPTNEHPPPHPHPLACTQSNFGWISIWINK